jgi:glutathione S-transferase
MYTLHGFSQSGNTFKVAFMLRALGQPFEVRFVDFMHGVTRSPEWRGTTNEMGEVPVLDDGAKRLTQSGVILTYLAGKHGRFLGASDDDKFEALRWLFFDNHKFTSYFATYRFMKAFGAVAPDPTVSKWLRGRIDNAFGIVEKHLASREYMVGLQPTLADLSLCGYLYFPPDESGYDIGEQFPAIARWLERVRQLPGWKPPYELLPGEPVAPRW